MSEAGAQATSAPWREARFGDLALRALDFQRDPIRFFRTIRERFGPTVVFTRPSRGASLLRPLVVTSDPALLRQILTDPAYRNSALALSGPRDSAHRRLRHSLFRMHGEEHRRHRNLIGPVLQRRASLRHVDAMVAVVDAVAERWKAGETRDLAADMKELALHVAATSLFGLSDLDASARLGHRIEDWWAESFKLLPRALPWNFAGTPFRRMLDKAEDLEGRVRAVIADKRSQIAAGEEANDLLTHLVRARDEQGGLSEDELLGQTHILFLAAHETTAYALTWTLFLLAQHPAAAERVCAELDEVLRGAPPTADRLDALPALGRAIDESLRLLPIVPFGARIAATPVEIGGRDFPRKSRVLMPFHLLHHDPAIFPSPRRFEPDRWEGFEPPPYTYLPFSAGLHMCIGISFAKITMQVALAMLLQRFRYRVAPGARIDRKVTVTMAPRHGLPVQLMAPDARWERVPVSGDVLDLVAID